MRYDDEFFEGELADGERYGNIVEGSVKCEIEN